MNSSLEIIKAYCALKRIRISNDVADSILSGIEKYERFKAIYDKTRADFSFRFCVYSSKRLSIFMEVSKHFSKTKNIGKFMSLFS